MPTRICSKCKQELSLDLFYVYKKTGEPFSVCKPCHRAYSKAYFTTHKTECYAATNRYRKKHLKERVVINRRYYISVPLAYWNAKHKEYREKKKKERRKEVNPE